MAKKQLLSVTEYCNKTGRFRQSVLRSIQQGTRLPGVSRVERVGTAYILHYKDSQSA